jgi:hypothetical protein
MFVINIFISLRCSYRVYIARKKFVRRLNAIILIQKIWRGSLQRPIYLRMLEEAREEARVNTKLAALQKRLADAEMKWILADKARLEAEKRAAGTPSLDVSNKEKKEEGSDDQKALLDESTK